MTIKNLIRTALESATNRMGYDILLGKRPEKSLAYVDRNQWEPYVNGDPRFALYRESMEITDMLASNTTVRELRYHALQQLISTVLANDVPGDFAECGCWKGLSAYITCKLIREYSSGPRQFHIFDSFEGGLSEKTSEDRGEHTISRERENEEKEYFSSTMEQLKRALSEFDFYTLNKGWIPERFPEYQDNRFAFVNVDVDLYEPTRDSFDFFFPRLSPGGIIYCDDYNAAFFPGAKKAIDECVERHRADVAMVFEIPLNAVFVVKGASLPAPD